MAIMKKIISVLLPLALCICLFGCGNSKNAENAGNPADRTVSFEVVTDENGIEHTVDSTEEDTASPDAKNDSENSEQNLTDKEQKTEKTTKGKSEADSKTDSKTQTTSEPKTQANSPTMPARPVTTTVPPTEKPAPAAITCTVRIECKKILDNKDKFTDDISIVPSDGVILKTTTVTIAEGSTAYDALIIAASKSGVTVNERNSAFGKYIVGFNGIDEKDCGAVSGWLYSVNGKSPSVGAEKYKLKNGDSIVFEYTC